MCTRNENEVAGMRTGYFGVLPEVAVTADTWHSNQVARAIAAAELAYTMGRKSPCVRGMDSQYRAIAQNRFDELSRLQAVTA
ncbi:MAG: hypothetical protein ACRC62_15835 [Microcoleus sp.]